MSLRSNSPLILPTFSAFIIHEAAKVTKKQGGTRRALELLDLVANIAIEKPERVPTVRTAMDMMMQRLDAEWKPGFRKPKAKATIDRAQRALNEQIKVLGGITASAKPAEILDDGMGGATQGLIDKTQEVWTGVPPNGTGVDAAQYVQRQG